MKQFLLIFGTLFSISSFSQNDSTVEKGKIEGVVCEYSSQEAIPFASVKLLNPSDSTLMAGVSTKDDGSFVLTPKFGKYIIEVSFVGYQKKHLDINLNSKKPSLKLDSIFLKDDAIALKEAEIVGDIPAMQVKGDTIEFNAGAYNSDGSSVLKDLIKQIPGLEMDDKGALKANGKPISKILVDGKEYFGNDIAMALTTLPATMITKLQLFEKESEEAKASGIKDNDPEQVLNLQVKEEFKRSVFGDTKNGIGNKGRHTNRFNLNKMHGDNQFSLVGDINNINDSEYRYGNDFDDNINKSLGANFNIQQSEKVSLNGSAKYNNYKTRDEYRSDSYTSILNQFTNNSGKSVNRRQNMDMNTTLDWKPDTLTTIYLRTGITYNDGNNISSSRDSARIVGKNTTSSENSRFSENNGFRISNSLMLSRKLNNKGRNISLSLNQSYNKDNSDGTNYSEKTYWEDNKLDIIDQLSNNDSKSAGYGASIRYVEPLGKDNRLYASYSINWNNADRIADVRKIDPITGEYTLVDKDYSRTTESESLRQNFRMGFQRTQEKYNFNLNFSVDPSYSRNKSYLEDITFDNPKQNVINFSPSARLGWTPDKNTHIDFDYYGSTQHPSITQLSADTVRHSAMSKSVGNPNLKPSFDNRFGLSYRKSDYESGRYLSASINYTFTMNSTVGYQIVDDHSNTINTYQNVDGNSSAYAYITFNTPLKNKKINIGSYFNIYHNKNIGFINTKKNIQNRISISPSVYGRFNSEKVEANLSFNVSHSMAHNNLAEIKRSDNTDYRLSNSLKVKLPLDFAIESELEFSYRTGLGEGVKKDETMWNLAASKLFLKEKRGTLKFEFYDVLNDLRKQQNTISGSDYNNYWRRVINNYFVFSFSYRFNIIQGKKG